MAYISFGGSTTKEVVKKMKMFRFSLGVIRVDLETRRTWFGCAEEGYIGQRVLNVELPGRSKRERPQRGFMDEVKEDNFQGRVKWR